MSMKNKSKKNKEEIFELFAYGTGFIFAMLVSLYFLLDFFVCSQLGKVAVVLYILTIIIVMGLVNRPRRKS